MKKEMVWYAIFPHDDAPKGMVMECLEGLIEPMGTIMEYMTDPRPFTVKFVRHTREWAKQFPEL